MSDTLVTIIGIFLAAVLMFVFPLMTVSNTQDNIAQVSVQSLVAEFVNNVATKGKITQDDYNTFISKLYATGNTYDVQLEHKKMTTNPNKGADDQIGENLYYSVYNSVIIDSTEAGINYNKEYLMKKGDYIIVTVKNTNTTIGSQIKNFMYSIIEKDIHRIAASSSALVVSSGSNKVNSNVNNDVDEGDSEEDSDVIDNLNTVTFDPNEGVCNVLSKQVIQGDIYGTLPTPTREGYIFTGWYTSATEGSQVTPTTLVQITESHTLYAHWQEKKYTIDINKKFDNDESYETSTEAGGKFDVYVNGNKEYDQLYDYYIYDNMPHGTKIGIKNINIEPGYIYDGAILHIDGRLIEVGADSTALDEIEVVGNTMIELKIKTVSPDLSYRGDGVFDGSTGEILSVAPQYEGGITSEGKESMIINATFEFNTLTSTTGEQQIIGTTQNSGWTLAINSQNKIRFSLYNKTKAQYESIVMDNILEINKKYNVTVVFHKGNIDLYLYNINNNEIILKEKKSGRIESTVLNHNNDIPTTVGANPTPQVNVYDVNCFLHGKIYNLNVWYNRTFTEDHIGRISEKAII